MNIGHLDHGKTTLAAALLYAEASTPRMNTWASLGRENEVALAVYALSIWLDPKTWRSHWHTTRQKRPGYLNTGTYLTVHTFFAAARRDLAFGAPRLTLAKSATTGATVAKPAFARFPGTPVNRAQRRAQRRPK